MVALGIAVIALAGLAPVTLAQAQTESYITDVDEAAACEGVCNTFVPPQTEKECRGLVQSRIYEEEAQHASAVNRLSRNRQENWMNPMEYSLTRRML